MSLKYIGVVIIGRNEGPRLISCLTSAGAQTANIVYVDSGSTDGSVEAAEKMAAHVVRLDLSEPFTAARARNAGFEHLMALAPNVRFVQFVDGDCTLADGWLEKALSFFEQQPNTAIVCGRRRERDPDASIYNQLCDLEWNTPIGEAKACGGDALMRVEAYKAVGGFRAQSIAGEEPELCVRLRERGWKIWRLDAEMTLHDAAMTRFRQWWLRSVRCGYAYAEVARLHRASEFGIWKRETHRAVLWGGVLPIAICLGAVLHPVLLVGGLIYLFQITRIAVTKGPPSFQSWLYAVFNILGKLPEFQGIVRFYRRLWSGQVIALIEYK